MKQIFRKYTQAPKWVKNTAIILLSTLLLVHVVLPQVLKYYLNQELNQLDGYYGEIEDVDLSLIRGSYSIEGLHLYSDDLGSEYPLALIDDIDISIQWKALFGGSLVAEIVFYNPRINFVIASAPQRDFATAAEVKLATAEKLEGVNNENRRNRIIHRQEKKINRQKAKEHLNKFPELRKTTNNFDKIQLTVFRDFLLDQIPLQVNHVETINGTLNYIDKSANPYVVVQTTKINLQLNNLTNSSALSETLIADFNLDALMMGSGKLSVTGALDPYDKDVTVDMDVKMNGFDLKELNKMFLAYASFDVDRGEMSLYSEVSTLRGELNGYIKPFIKDLSILSFKDDSLKSPVNFVWQSVLGGGSKLTRNLIYDELATKIPLKGNVSEPSFKIWNAIGNLFLHAIFRSIQPKVDAEYQLEK